MSPEEAAASYRQGLAAAGDRITLVRLGPDGKPALETTPLAARVTGYKPEELVAGIKQADRKVILLAADVVASGFSLPLGDATHRLRVEGRLMKLEGVDDTTRRVAGVLIAYQIQARG